MSRRRFLTMQEIDELINVSSSEDESQEPLVFNENTKVVYIPPAKLDLISDEECIDDEDLVNDIPPTLEIAGEIEVEYDSTSKDFSAPLLPSALLGESSTSTSAIKSKKYTPECDFGEPCWRKTNRLTFNFEAPNESFVEPIQKNIAETMCGKTPLQLFLQYFDEEVMGLLVENSNLYAHQNNIMLTITKERLYRFIGILIFSGYHTVPQFQMYWARQPDLGIPIIKQAMSRNVFCSIKKIFHLMDNTQIDTSDRFAKIRPLIDLLNKKYQQFGIFSTFLSIDEQMIPYFGRHNCKMFIRGKPIRFGFKYWCICSDTGYLYEAMPYAGAATPYDKQIGLGASVVLKLLECVPNPEHHAVYFDNFFSSYYLFCLLNERGFRAIGTVRANRLRGADTFLASTSKNKTHQSKHKADSLLKKHEYDTVFEKNNKLFVARWHDNNEVNVISNYVGAQPEVPVLRYSRDLKKKVSLPQPKIINEYNKYMGGVDLHDNGVANYRIAVRGKKWWWPLWTNCVNSASVNAWKIHCMVAKAEGNPPMSQIQFKSDLARGLLLYEDRHEQKPESEGSGVDAATSGLPRLAVNEHIIWKIPDRKRKRCAKCHSQTVFECKKCNKSLHPKCFDNYHGENLE